MTSLIGAAGEDFASVLRALGYRMEKRPKPAEPTPASAEASAAEAPAEPAPAESAAGDTPAPEVTPDAYAPKAGADVSAAAPLPDGEMIAASAEQTPIE